MNSSSLLTFSVPSDYTGDFLICTGYGVPTPSIEWIRAGQVLDSRRITSNSASNGQPHFVSATMRLHQTFDSSDVGKYYCIIQTEGGGSTQSRIITLTKGVRSPATATPKSATCSQNTSYFQLRFLDTNCFSWANELRNNISSNFEVALASAVSAECEDCSLINDIMLTSGPVCSSRIKNAAVFWGMITTENPTVRSQILCALITWHKKSPIFSFWNRTLNRVDPSCPVEIMSANYSGCEQGAHDLSDSAMSTIPAVGVALLIVVLLVVTSGVVFLFYLIKKMEGYVYTAAELLVVKSGRTCMSSIKASPHSPTMSAG